MLDTNMKTFKIHFMNIIKNEYDVFISHSKIPEFNVALNTDLYIYYSHGKYIRKSYKPKIF